MNTKNTYKIGQDNINMLGLDIHNPVFVVSSISIIIFIVITLLFQQQVASFFGWLRPAITNTFDWLFLSAANIFVIFSLFLAVSPLGKIRLGGVDAKPDYSYVGWFSLIFAAGMGIGLMFFGVSEPISHFNSSMC
ncbi:High-affinity choline uptake protein BetT [uncultured Gammaproteobacteria bacterium]|nr:High-affinity choline uptake protein BetT [uncultured Gammaproteobacteria bacterium]SMN12883.1 High-affinity choline uptake protein BetT [Bathymodiolus heckerae thiotrophic gill symbiont]